jgi:hypothetical protein
MKYSKTDIGRDDLVKEFFLSKNIRRPQKNII